MLSRQKYEVGRASRKQAWRLETGDSRKCRYNDNRQASTVRHRHTTVNTHNKKYKKRILPWLRSGFRIDLRNKNICILQVQFSFNSKETIK